MIEAIDNVHREEQDIMESIASAVEGWGYRTYPRADGDLGYKKTADRHPEGTNTAPVRPGEGALPSSKRQR
ncbi:MAG: hypothetical protein PVJ55_07280 [Anaerolineae bacterium]|jgi:hypothetical protein